MKFRADPCSSISVPLLAVYTWTPAVAALVNCGSIGLLVILRKSIRLNFEASGAFQESRFDKYLGKDVMVLSSSENKSYEPDSERKDVVLLSPRQPDRILLPTLMTRPKPSHGCRQSMDSTHEVGGDAISFKFVEAKGLASTKEETIRFDGNSKRFEGEALRHLKDLLRAETELKVVAFTIFGLAIALTAISIWIAVKLRGIDPLTKWVEYDFIKLRFGTRLTRS